MATEILIAEDSRIQARMLERCLKDAGFEVRSAADGAIALEMVREKRPTLIISDIEMPNMSGYEFCEAVKQDADLKTIPLVLLSTLSDAEDIIRGLHVGADNYVTKPYDRDYLLSRVQSLLDTPIDPGDDGEQTTLDVTLAGKRYQVKAGRQQVLNLLISTFENAVEKNSELIRTNQDLSITRDLLEKQNTELGNLNQKLESSNDKMTRDLNAAAVVQQSLLPSEMPEVEHVKFAWKYLPCDELAGDFLNIFQLDDHNVGMFVVDVSGHGVASSLLSVTVGRVLTPQVSTSSLLVREVDGTRSIVPPHQVLAELNNRFPMEEQGNLYFTMVYAVMNKQTGEVRIASAGHPPVILARKGQQPELIPVESLAIGWVEDLDFAEDEVTVQLQAGDRIFLYSDGIPEGMDENLDQFGDDLMLENVAANISAPLEGSVDALLNAVTQWCKVNGPKDDVSILGMELTKRGD